MKTEKRCHSCFSVLADATRMRILKELRCEAKNVSELTEKINVTQPTISHHLKLLDAHGLVHKERRGREVYYIFNPNYPCRGCGVFRAPIRT